MLLHEFCKTLISGGEWRTPIHSGFTRINEMRAVLDRAYKGITQN